MTPEWPVAHAWIDPFDFGPDSAPLTLPAPAEDDYDGEPVTQRRPQLAQALASEMHLAGEGK